MDLTSQNSYFNDFTTSLSDRLKPGWGIQMSIYPFRHGAVVVVDLKKESAHSLKRKSESVTLGDALRKTHLFNEANISLVADKSVADTIIGIISTTKYVLFKSENEDCWSKRSVQQDIEKIIANVKAGYGK